MNKVMNKLFFYRIGEDWRTFLPFSKKSKTPPPPNEEEEELDGGVFKLDRCGSVSSSFEKKVSSVEYLDIWNKADNTNELTRNKRTS